MLVFKDLNNTMWQISKVDDISNLDELIDKAKDEVNYFRPIDSLLDQQFVDLSATQKLRQEQDGGLDYRLESVKHAKEDHLGPGGIAAGLQAAAGEAISGRQSFEEDDDYEYDDESDESDLSEGSPADQKGG